MPMGTFDIKGFTEVDLPRCNINPGRILMGVNLYRGVCCPGGGCAYCYARSFRVNTMNAKAPKVASLESAAGLRTMGHWPDFLFLSSSSEPLLPDPQVMAATRALTTLAFEKGTFVSFSTKQVTGDPSFLELLEKNSVRTSVSISLTSLNAGRNRALEVGAPCAEESLAFAKELVERGINVWIKIDAICPGLDDEAAAIAGLCRAIRAAGVKKVLFSYAFHRPAVRRRLGIALAGLGAGHVLASMNEEQDIAAGMGWSLPLKEKVVRLALMVQAARAAGVERVSTCGCKNDIDHQAAGFDSRACEFHWGV